jgi:hypothetical protein
MEISIKLIKKLEVNFQYDFIIKYYSLDADFQYMIIMTENIDEILVHMIALIQTT